MSSLLQHLHEHEANEPSAADRPSIYELLATDELRDLVQPAFRYVLAFFAQRHPRYLLRLVNRHEEVYALFMLLVEGHHLRQHDSSFADGFYNLRYRSSRSEDSANRLSGRQKLLVLSFIVGIPYAKAKLKDLYERLGGGLDPEIARQRRENDPRGSITSTSSRLKNLCLKLFKFFYPYCILAYAILEVGYDIKYAFASRGEWRWWMPLVGVSVVRDDGSLTAVNDTLASSSLLRSLPRQALTNLFPITLLALKFSQWWYSPASPRTAHMEETGGKDRVRVPPPRMIRPIEKGWTGLNPKRRGGRDLGGDGDGQDSESDEDIVEDEVVEEESEYAPLNWDDDSVSSSSSGIKTPPASRHDAASPGSRKPLAYGHCPICEEPWANPTTLPTGYVGCYLCLYRFVEKREICPVTGISLKDMGGVDSLRKVLV